MPRLLALLIALLVLAPSARAQPQSAPRAAITVAPGPLADALGRFRRTTRVDLVYARRLVAGKQTACRYEGSDADAALRCLLEGTGLDAVRLRQGQYAIRRARVAAATAPAAPPRPRRETLAGFVVDAETGEVLPGAYVYLPDDRRGTAASDAGYFAVPDLPAGGHRARFSYVGYRPVDTLLLTQSARNVVRLRAARLQVAEVVVERGRGQEPPPAGATDLAEAQLDALPVPFGEQDVLRKLEWLPGVARTGEATGGLVVRGGEPDENLYLLDGAPVYHPWHASSLVSTFQAETVNRVRIYRGLFPAEYGGRLSSVVETEMKDGNRETPRATAGASLLAARYVIESPITAGSSFMVSGRRSYVDKLIGARQPVEDAAGRRDTLRTGYYFSDFTAKVTYRPGYRHRLSVSHYQGGDALDVRLPFDFSFDLGSLLRPADFYYDVVHDWGNDLQSVRYQFLQSPRFFWTVTAYRTAYGARERTTLRPSEQSVISSDYTVRLVDTGVRADVEVFQTRDLRLQFGLQGARRRFRSLLYSFSDRAAGTPDPPTRARTDQEALEAAAFVQVHLQASPRTDVQAGVRASMFGPGAYVHVLPNVSVQHRVRPGRLTLRGGASAQVQYLHRLRDRTSLLYALVSERWTPASTTVRPARGIHASAGAEAVIRPGVVASADVYARAADGVLVPADLSQTKSELGGTGVDLAALLGQYVPAKARAVGLETAFQAERGPWRFYTAYTFERSERRPRGDSTFQAARYNVPHRLEAIVRRSGRRWGAALTGELRSGYPIARPTARYRVGDGLGDPPVAYLERPRGANDRLPVYARLDATLDARFAFAGARWRAAFQLYNASVYRNVIGRTYTPGASGVVQRDRRGLQIFPLLEIEIQL